MESRQPLEDFVHPEALSRSESYFSLNSAIDDEEELNDATNNLHNIFLILKNNILKIHKSEHLHPSLKKNTKAAKTSLAKLDKIITTLAREKLYFQDVHSEAVKNAEAFHSSLNKLIEKIPSQEEINASITQTIQTSITSINDKFQEMELLKEAVLKINREITEASTSPALQTDKTTTDSTPVNKPKRITLSSNPDSAPYNPEPAHRRTIIMRSRNNQKTGTEIRDALFQSNINAPAHSVEKITTRRSHIEITFKDSSVKELIKKELMSHQTLNRTFNFYNKTFPAQKMILFNVPDTTTDETITQEIINRYAAHPEEIIHLKPRKSQTPNQTNRIIVLPIPLGQAIIQDGGLPVGINLCRLRPFTQVLRCRKCQDTDHTEKNCINNQYCERCGRKGNHESCSAPPGCINCHMSNKDKGTKLDTKHTASDAACPVYREAYTQERQRLDEIFIPRPPIQHKPNNNPPTSSRPTSSAILNRPRQQQNHSPQNSSAPVPVRDGPPSHSWHPPLYQHDYYAGPYYGPPPFPLY